MDNLLEKYRTLGVISLIVAIGFYIILSFVTLREKKNVAFKTKMFFSDMSQAVQYSVNNNGHPGDWDWSQNPSETIENNVINTLIVSQNCIKTGGSCFYNGMYKNLAGKKVRINFAKMPSVKLQNGLTVAFETIGSCKEPNETCMLAYVDINGKDAPNKIGRDLFAFELTNSANMPLKPYGIKTPSKMSTDNKYGCKKNSELPLYCSALISSSGWRIEKNYPW